ncbi:hypothetical protein LEN26_001765 [Aphanomyces euteiches]|nr:hypothetical protein LEN26_001765 [Aphanomyces euteiches]
MYIGPWQEYKLAKIQDAAVQKLRQEWEAHLKSTLVAPQDGEDERIRQMMEPILAKLPSMLLSNRAKPSSQASQRATKRSIRPPPPNNQESIQERRVPPKAISKQKKAKTPLSSIDAVARRRQMWKEPTEPRVEEPVRLPQVAPQLEPSVAVSGPPTAAIKEPVHLPAIIAQPEVDEDSLDEDELNSFLNWTDQLAHPDMDEFLNG